MIADLKSERKTTIETIKTLMRSFRKKIQMGRQHCVGRALNHYKIKPAVSICILDYSPSYVYIFIFLLIVFIPNMYINNMYFGILIHFKD